MGELYLPPGARPRRFAVLRTGDRDLPSVGLHLIDRGPCSIEGARGRIWQHGKDGDDRFRVIASMDQTPHGELLHVSMSRRDRLPSWEEVRAVKDCFYGTDIDAVMVLPSEADYVNLHNWTMHLWQTPTVWGLQ